MARDDKNKHQSPAGNNPPTQKRREFLKFGAIATAAALGGGIGSVLNNQPPASAPDSPSEKPVDPPAKGMAHIKGEILDGRLMGLTPGELENINTVADRLDIRLNGQPAQELFNIYYEITPCTQPSRNYTVTVRAGLFEDIMKTYNTLGKDAIRMQYDQGNFIMEGRDGPLFQKIERAIQQQEAITKPLPSGDPEALMSIQRQSREILAAAEAMSGRLRPLKQSARGMG